MSGPAIFALILALTRIAVGQQAGTAPATREESLEHRLADADVVVLGSMAPSVGQLVSVTILEAFKGSTDATLLTALRSPEQGPPTITPTPAGVQDLIFLKKLFIPPGGTAYEWVMRSHVRLDDVSGVYTTDLNHLTDTDEIIAATRRAIAFNGPEQKKSAVLLFPPQPAAKGKPMPGYLVVPVDSRLETIAHGWAEARDAHARIRAARALSHFRSAHNVEILKSLLSDTATPFSVGSGKWKRGVYAVREEAYKTLASWGMEVEMPELEGPMYQYRRPYLDWLVMIPVAFVGWVALNGALQWRQFQLGRTLLQGLTFLSLVCAAALVVLWVRSWFVVDEVMYPAGTDHHQVASYRGGVHYLAMLEAEIGGGPLYGNFDLSNVEDQWGLSEHSPTERWQRGGFGFAAGRMMGPGDTPYAYRVLRVPYYPLLAAALVLPTLGMWQWWRSWRRSTQGLCRTCGYDMRASRGRCPECGAVEAVAV